MRVINIEKLKNRKNKVILDNGEILYLYNSEIIKLGLDIDSNIDDDLYEVIIRDYIFARAKKKALAILERSMNSVYQIRTKLKRADYSDKVIDDVIHFLEYYNFVDDYLFLISSSHFLNRLFSLIFRHRQIRSVLTIPQKMLLQIVLFQGHLVT